MNLSKNQTNELLYVSFNQDFTCFVCSTLNGFRIYTCDPFSETFTEELSNRGVGLIEMLFKCNILALVGGGRNPFGPPNKVILWDDQQKKAIGDLSFRTEVKSIRLRRDRVVVVLSERIYVYNFTDLRLLDHIETCDNPKGLCVVSADSERNVLACPGIQKGHVRVELYNSKKTVMIEAHNGAIACMCLNRTGSLVATCSEKGTLIRLFDTITGNPLHELRRGYSEATIHCLALSSNSELLAVSSSRGTIHIFHSNCGEEKDDEEKRQRPQERSQVSSTDGLFSVGSRVTNYFATESSFAKFNAPSQVQTHIAFGKQHGILLVIGSDGSFYKLKFDPSQGGSCQQESFVRFIHNTGEAEL